MIKKKIIALGICSVILCNNVPFAFAATDETVEDLPYTTDETGTYLEYHTQINLDNMDIMVLNEDELQVTPNSSSDVAKQQRDIDQLIDFFADYEDAADNILDQVNSDDQLAAISYTEAPLLFENDHYERVPVARAAEYKEGTTNSTGKFSMYSTVSRAYDGSKYTFITQSCGAWSANSIIGGSDYPSGGDDFILQSVPNTFSRVSDDFTAYFTSSPTTGVSGSDFWATDGGKNYLKYVVKDDPAGARQNKSFWLKAISYAPASSSIRQVNSYYVHTWKQLSISVSVAATSAKVVSLSITPSIQDKSWTLYNYVSFDF